MGDTKGFGTHLKKITYEIPIYDEPELRFVSTTIRVNNTQKLAPHVHVDMKPRAQMYRGRYIGHDEKGNRYANWKSKSEIR